MDDGMESVRNRGRFGFGLSIVAGIVAFGWFFAQGNAYRGFVAFLLFFVIGGWEYRRRMQNERSRRRHGMGAENRDDRDRK